MAKKGKNYLAAFEKVEPEKRYALKDAVTLLKEIAFAKFDETVELTMWLGVDPRKADQMVRGTTVLPHGTGKKVKVLVLAKGDKAKEAEDAGADFVGSDEYIEKIQGGWADVDTIIATPDMMGQVGKLGKILGPRKLMPNPKSGTVTPDVAKAVAEFKAGRVEFRNDRYGNVHLPVGKVSFTAEQLIDNLAVAADEILRSRPAAAKGRFVRRMTVSSTMGVGVKIDPSSAEDLVKELH